MRLEKTVVTLVLMVLASGCRGGGFFLDPEEADRELGLPGSTEREFGSAIAYEHATRAEILAARGDFEGAVAEYELALVSDPRDVYLKARLAEAYLELEEFQVSKRHIEQILKRDNRSELGWLALAKYHRAKGEIDKAEQAARRAIRVEPFGLHGALWLAGLHREQGEQEHAEEILGNLVLAHPSEAEPRLMLAQTLLDLGRGLEAKEHLEVFVRLRPFRADIVEKIADLTLEGGDKAGAVELFEIAARKDPSNQLLRLKLIRLCLSLNLKKRAKRHLDSLPPLSRGDVRAGTERACLFARAGESYRARALLVDQWGKRPNDPMVALTLAEIELELGRLEIAEVVVDGVGEQWTPSQLAKRDALLRQISNWPDGTEPCDFLKD